MAAFHFAGRGGRACKRRGGRACKSSQSGRWESLIHAVGERRAGTAAVEALVLKYGP
jgi:hypothetical protein